MPEDLPVGYYLDNFHFLLDHVRRRYHDILSPEEDAFAEEFHDLAPDSQRLYVRLACRKGPLFRADKVRYAEIADNEDAVRELAGAGWLDHGEDAAPEELLGLLTKPELLELDTDLAKSARRDELVAQLLETLSPGDIIAACSFTILRPLKLDILQIYKLLFFGNMRQDFTEFVLNDLGITPYEKYSIEKDVRFFEDRCVMEQTLQLHELGDLAEEVVAEGGDALKGFVELVPGSDELVHDKLGRRRDRIVNHVARQLEREEELELALTTYESCSIAPSRERRARIHDRLGHIDVAIEVCWDIMRSPEVEAEYEFAVGFLKRLYKKKKLTPPQPLPELGNEVEWRDVAVPFDASQKVELLARDWFEQRDHEAWYVENGLLPGLFGMAFWDIIFWPVPGVFHHPFQRGPADLFTAEFRQQRQALIHERLADIENPANLRRRVESCFCEKQGLANYFVDWRVLDETLLERALDTIPNDHLLSVFRRLLRDLRANRSGFPDLVVFPPEGGYRLVEIKGPGDTLQDNQKRWLRHFRETGMPAEVARVSWR